MKIHIESEPAGGPAERPSYVHHIEGLTLRDMFAMAALAGTGSARMAMTTSYEEDAEHYYRVADAMLAARKEQSNG